MGFSEKVKSEALQRSVFRCCICKDMASEIHHIIPQEHGGPDILENAAPLCSSCHDYYGDNPTKIDKIRSLRDHWWKMVEIKYQYAIIEKSLSHFEGIGAEVDDKVIMREQGSVMIPHIMLPEEDFYITAHMLVDSLKKTQKLYPYRHRVLYIAIEKHKNSAGGFDKDAFEIVSHFSFNFLIKYCVSIITPFGEYHNPYPQWNNIPDEFRITPSIKDRYEQRNDG